MLFIDWTLHYVVDRLVPMIGVVRITFSETLRFTDTRISLVVDESNVMDCLLVINLFVVRAISVHVRSYRIAQSNKNKIGSDHTQINHDRG